MQSPPRGRYEGHAWIIGVPLAGWLIRWLWTGKDFAGATVTNRILGRSLFPGQVAFSRNCRDVVIVYDRPPIRDTLRQVSPALWLGRMRARWLTVHFTLERAQG